jgi:hypothetical protein
VKVLWPCILTCPRCSVLIIIRLIFHCDSSDLNAFSQVVSVYLLNSWAVLFTNCITCKHHLLGYAKGSRNFKQILSGTAYNFHKYS